MPDYLMKILGFLVGALIFKLYCLFSGTIFNVQPVLGMIGHVLGWQFIYSKDEEMFVNILISGTISIVLFIFLSMYPVEVVRVFYLLSLFSPSDCVLVAIFIVAAMLAYMRVSGPGSFEKSVHLLVLEFLELCLITVVWAALMFHNEKGIDNFYSWFGLVFPIYVIILIKNLMQLWKHNKELMKELLDALVIHGPRCRENPCSYPTCNKLRRVFSHAHQCNRRLRGGCEICKFISILLHSHARDCKVANCEVTRCEDLKRSINLETTQDSNFWRKLMIFGGLLWKEISP